MAGDTRDPTSSPIPSTSSSSTPPPSSSSSSKTYETFAPPANANALPDGAGRNTAGAHAETSVPKLSEAVKTLRLQDFKQVHMYPCVRDSLLIGIGGAFGMGGVRIILGASIIKACNWAVGTFCFAGIANYEFCQQKRRLEKMNMKRAIEIMDRKKAEKEAQMRKVQQERRAAREEAEKRSELAKKSNWKFW